MKPLDFSKPYLTSADLAAHLSTTAAMIEAWPFDSPKPPVQSLDGRPVFSTAQVHDWLALYMTDEETADVIGVSRRQLDAMRVNGYGPSYVNLGRGEPAPISPGSHTWRQGREIVLYERAAVERWLNPPPPGRRGGRA